MTDSENDTDHTKCTYAEYFEDEPCSNEPTLRYGTFYSFEGDDADDEGALFCDKHHERYLKLDEWENDCELILDGDYTPDEVWLFRKLRVRDSDAWVNMPVEILCAVVHDEDVTSAAVTTFAFYQLKMLIHQADEGRLFDRFVSRSEGDDEWLERVERFSKDASVLARFAHTKWTKEDEKRAT